MGFDARADTTRGVWQLSMYVSKSGRAELTPGRRTGYCTSQDMETNKQTRGEQGVSGILKRGRRGHATLCLSQDTSGTDCHDYKSELSNRVLESARRNAGGTQDPRHFMRPYSTTPRDLSAGTRIKQRHKGNIKRINTINDHR